MKRMCVCVIVVISIFLAFLPSVGRAIVKVSDVEYPGKITKVADGGNGKFYISTDWSTTSGGVFSELEYVEGELVQRRAHEDQFPLSGFDYYDHPEYGRFFYIIRGFVWAPQSPGFILGENDEWGDQIPKDFVYWDRIGCHDAVVINDTAIVFREYGDPVVNAMMYYQLENPLDPDMAGSFCYNLQTEGRVQKAVADNEKKYLYLAHEETDGFEFFKYVGWDYCPTKQMTLFLASNHYSGYKVEVKDFVVEGNQLWLLFYDKNYWAGGLLKMDYDFDSDPLFTPERLSYGLYDSDPNCIFFDGRMKSMTKVGDKFFVAKGPDGFCVIENQKITQDFPDIPADEIIWIGGERQEMLVVFENNASVYSLFEGPEPPVPPKKKADITALILLLLGDE